MNELRIITTYALIIFGAVDVLLNWWSVAISIRNKKKGVNERRSVVPLVSLLTSGLAYFIGPFEHMIWVWAIPMLDPGNWIFAIGLPMALARGGLKGRGGSNG